MTPDKIELIVYLSTGILFISVSVFVTLFWYLNAKQKVLLNNDLL